MSPLGYADPEDRGPAKYFHGRTAELATFQSVLEQAESTRGGTILLFQGPPGAGKSALLHECAVRARQAKWSTAKIKGDALHDPVTLAQKLGLRLPDTVRKRDAGGAKVGVRGVLEFALHGEVEDEREYRGSPTEQVLETAAGYHGVLLLVDEVQNLAVGVQTTEAEKPAISKNLELIHNGEMGVPVVLVAGGLGTSQKVLESFGISRFHRRRVHLLGSLSPPEARAVIHDWLVNDGGALADHPELSRWIDTLAAECHGWPQHLQVYAQQAAGWLEHHSGELTRGVPLDVLVEARRDRLEYYAGRVADLEDPDRIILANMVRDKGKGGTLLKKELVAALTEDRTREEAEQLFDKLLHKGVITGTGRYHIPIPSMHDWLVREYAEPVR